MDPWVAQVRAGLHADCAHCFALCCVASGFSRSADFAIDKKPGRPCPHLRRDFRCGIHPELRDRGFPGCAVFDCLGAGQQVSQVTFEAVPWRQNPSDAAAMFGVFGVMRQLHEVLWYLCEALGLDRSRGLHPQLQQLLEEVLSLTEVDAASLLDLDVVALRGRANALLTQVSRLQRAEINGADLYRADLAGADLRRADLVGANLRGACLIGADLREVDLRLGDLTGADLRAADLRGADLADSLFLTPVQLNAAVGDSRTRLPDGLARPVHWAPH